MSGGVFGFDSESFADWGGVKVRPLLPRSNPPFSTPQWTDRNNGVLTRGEDFSTVHFHAPGPQLSQRQWQGSYRRSSKGVPFSSTSGLQP